ncbi:hypothetical protein [Nocardioides sp. SYSU D00038]|uniref:hypothetical protein n=1 Tax=Nocardioides sp. SYSU D00038 TaxID=2812554 RepID=UPI00196703CC|nr:hypothetical protein [Nocardioides sp. SYSU D00038]
MNTRLLSLPSLALAASLSLAACGGDDGGDGGSGDSGSGGDFTSLSGKEIADEAKETMLELDGVHLSGEASSEGNGFALDIAVDAEGDCTGELTAGGETITVLGADGDVWFQAPQTQGKWIVDDGTFGDFCDLEKFLGNLFADNDDDEYEVGEVEQVAGEDAVPVTKKDDEGDSTGYVKVDGDHYLLKLSREGADGGEFTFDSFDEDVETEAPAEADIATE